MLGKGQSEILTFIDISVFSILQVFLEALTDLFGDIGENIIGFQFLYKVLNDFNLCDCINLLISIFFLKIESISCFSRLQRIED